MKFKQSNFPVVKILQDQQLQFKMMLTILNIGINIIK
jgi:hypothetical protein